MITTLRYCLTILSLGLWVVGCKAPSEQDQQQLLDTDLEREAAEEQAFLALKPFSPTVSAAERQRRNAKVWQHLTIPKTKDDAFFGPIIYPNDLKALGNRVPGRGDWLQKLERRYGLHSYAFARHPKHYEAKGGAIVKTVPTCNMCHAGRLEGELVIGRPNIAFDFATFWEDAQKHNLAKPYKMMGRFAGLMAKSAWGGPGTFARRALMLKDLGDWYMDPGNHAASQGTSNAFGYGVKLLTWRDDEINYYWQPESSFRGANPRDLPYKNVDLDAPPWWNVKYKQHLYYDATARKSPRAIMQFLMAPENSGERIRGFEPLFRDLLAWVETLEPPKYPKPVDAQLVSAGEELFNGTCANCHGIHSEQGEYWRSAKDFQWPARVVPAEQIGTDPRRSLAYDHRAQRALRNSWMGYYGKSPDLPRNRGGYVAPPLFGIWASAPYLHNGAVPTLYHMMHPEERPLKWRLKDTRGMIDHEKMGLEIIENPQGSSRAIFNSLLPGKSVRGHEAQFRGFNATQKTQLLEYLKTL